VGKQLDSERQKAWEVRQRERESQWRKHLAAWQASGLSQAGYCRQVGLAPADFSWWKHELARRDGRRAADRTRQGMKAGPQFVPLQLTAGQSNGECEVLLCNGRRLRIGNGADPRWAGALAAALESVAPC